MAIPHDNENARKSTANLDGVTTVPVEQITCFEMLNHRYMVISKSDLEAWLTGAGSRMDKNAKNIRTRQTQEAA